MSLARPAAIHTKVPRRCTRDVHADTIQLHLQRSSVLEVDSANNTPNSPSAVAPWKSFSVTRYLTDVKALFEAAEVNDPAAAALLLNKVDANVPHPKSLATPMHVAAESNAYAVISLLVAVGGNIEARERGIGATPLILAAQANATAAALALIRAGAHADSADMCDFTALHYAGLWHHPNLDPNVVDSRLIIISHSKKRQFAACPAPPQGRRHRRHAERERVDITHLCCGIQLASGRERLDQARGQHQQRGYRRRHTTPPCRVAGARGAHTAAAQLRRRYPHCVTGIYLFNARYLLMDHVYIAAVGALWRLHWHSQNDRLASGAGHMAVTVVMVIEKLNEWHYTRIKTLRSSKQHSPFVIPHRQVVHPSHHHHQYHHHHHYCPFRQLAPLLLETKTAENRPQCPPK